MSTIDGKATGMGDGATAGMYESKKPGYDSRFDRDVSRPNVARAIFTESGYTEPHTGGSNAYDNYATNMGGRKDGVGSSPRKDYKEQMDRLEPYRPVVAG
jgi:hypothetical protein